ncbi:MAG: alpha/beta hydrolase [Bryobacteraceae bacterium]
MKLRRCTLLLLASAAYGATPSLTLGPCPDNPALCGTFARPLDPTGQTPGSIIIGFELFSAADISQPPLGTIVAVEGGPGFASTGSAAGYLGLFKPLLDRRNLLIIDNRGTGLSGAIDCQPLQTQLVQTVPAVGLCGAELRGASDLYGTALATDDMAAVLEALGTGPVDLYGDSYGTWYSQAFAVNHPELVRAVILDSAYPVIGENPFYPFSGIFNRLNYNMVCQRSLSCQDLPGTSQDRIDALTASLRASPFTGKAYDGNGNLRPVAATPTSLAYAIYAGTMGEVIYRDLDAAARAYLSNGDTVPLLRLFAENDLTSAFAQPGGKDTEYSRGLFAAVSCSDYPQLYDMTVPPSERVTQEQAAIAQENATDPGVFAPFTIDEFRKMSIDVSVLDLCLNWPIPSPLYPPQHSVPPNATFPPVPVLVLSGELDSLTTPAEGKLAADLFPNAQQVLIANSFHVTAVEDEDHCASVIARTFFLTLSPGDTSCASQIAEVRTVPNFATVVADVQPATPLAGNQGTTTDLQLAADATLAAGDAVARWFVNFNESGVGLRGGTWTYTQNSPFIDYTLENVQWTTDVTVSGTIDWNYGTGAIAASLLVNGPGATTGDLVITWNNVAPHAMATIGGLIGGRTIAAVMYAP